MKVSSFSLSRRYWSAAQLILRSAAVCLVIMFLPLALSAASLRIEGERAWLQAEDEPLSEILQLFEQRGAEVLVDPSVQLRRISGDWKDVRVDWLISRLAAPHSHMLEWRREKSHLGDIFRISSIRIFPEGRPYALRPLAPSKKTLDVVTGENGVKYIRSEILVGFSQESSIEELKALLSRLNGSVIEVIDPPGLYRIRLNDDLQVEEALRIAQVSSGVRTAESNLAFEAIVSNTLASPESAGGINLHLFPGETAIAVLDSGLDPAYTDYPFIRDTYDALDPGAKISDPTGHGTLTSLIAAGVITPIGAEAAESGVPVLSIRTFDENGMTSSDTIMRALKYAADSGVKIISMSWGSDLSSQFLETAMAFAAHKGLTLYAAAGNKPTGTPVYPAGYDSVIAVGGLNPDGSRWKDSNYGEFVKEYEPAFAIFNNKSFAGTSIASPYAAFKAAQNASE